jgi:hypothetical protein
MKGSEAIRDVFAFQRALGSLWRGVLELFGISGLVRRSGGGLGYARRAFERHGVSEPLDELPRITDQLGPRMEGQDVQDIDDLVHYARREIQALPEAIQSKVIGVVNAPQQYDRRALQSLRPALEAIETEARHDEAETLDQTLRNTTLSLVVYEVLLLLVGFFISQVGVTSSDGLVILFIVVLALALLGFAFIPLRGRMAEAAYTRRMLDLQRRYVEAVTDAARKQLDYSMQLRRETVAPLTRLVEAQTEVQKGQLQKLEAAQRELTSIESALTTLGKKRLLNL